MRAREFIREQTATMPAPGVSMPDTSQVPSKTKELVKKVGSKSIDVIDKGILNPLSYASGAGLIGDQSAANFVGDQAKMRNAGTALQAIGDVASKTLPKIAPALGKVGTVLKTGTGPVGTAATLAVRSGNAGSAYGPYADNPQGRNDWMTKHGYDPAKPGEYQRAEQDYKTAKSNYTKNASWGELANRALNPFADALPDDDEIMAKRKPDVK